jgi:hypothetical protein
MIGNFDFMQYFVSCIKTPTISKFAIDELPVIRLAAKSSLKPTEFYDLVKDKVNPILASVEGVAQVDLNGGEQREIKVFINPDKLIYYNLSINQINQIIGMSNLDYPTGKVKNNQNQIFKHLNIEKKLVSQLIDIKGKISLGQFSHGSVESFFVAKKIEELIKEKVNLNEIAILYKEHRDAAELIDFLSKLNIPYIIEIGGNILEDPEIDKIIAYLKVLNIGIKQTDYQSLIEIMHYPFFGISPLDIYKVISESHKLRKNLFNVIASNKIIDGPKFRFS